MCDGLLEILVVPSPEGATVGGQLIGQFFESKTTLGASPFLEVPLRIAAGQLISFELKRSAEKRPAF
jgi:hypothetical protein